MSIYSEREGIGERVSEDRPSSEPLGANSIRRLSLNMDPNYPLIGDPAQVAASEHFAVMRSRLLNANVKSGIRTVLVTSSQKGEGKTLVSTNLAISVAQLNRHRVLLVDGDLRVAGVSHLLGIQQETGLGEFLEGAVGFDASIRASGVPGLSVVGRGNLQSDALPAVLEGPKWAEFLLRARQEFDIIIVDSVPVIAPIADFELLAAPCDGVLLIVHLHKTEPECLETSLAKMNGKLMGVVINNSEPPAAHEYYSYYDGTKKRK